VHLFRVTIGLNQSHSKGEKNGMRFILKTARIFYDVCMAEANLIPGIKECIRPLEFRAV
jgi:hypothetical protein